jgi:hypothetical protein
MSSEANKAAMRTTVWRELQGLENALRKASGRTFNNPVAVTGIHLLRIGDSVIVRVEIDGKWVEVIREQVDGLFSHIVEPSGIRARALLEGQT